MRRMLYLRLAPLLPLASAAHPSSSERFRYLGLS
jgi:hypothetical protein